MALEGLKAFDDEWDGMETPEKKEFETIPNGKYQAKIDKAYMDEAKSSGADLLCLELVIIAGKFKNRRLFKRNTLLTRENISWLKDDLKKIEVAITPISKLDEQLDKFSDVVVEVYVKNKVPELDQIDYILFENVSVVDLPQYHPNGRPIRSHAQ